MNWIDSFYPILGKRSLWPDEFGFRSQQRCFCRYRRKKCRKNAKNAENLLASTEGQTIFLAHACRKHVERAYRPKIHCGFATFVITFLYDFPCAFFPGKIDDMIMSEWTQSIDIDAIKQIWLKNRYFSICLFQIDTEESKICYQFQITLTCNIYGVNVDCYLIIYKNMAVCARARALSKCYPLCESSSVCLKLHSIYHQGPLTSIYHTALHI